MAAKLKDKRTSITTVSSIFQTFAIFATPSFLVGPTVKFFGLHKFFFLLVLCLSQVLIWFVLNLFFPPCSLSVSGVDLACITFFLFSLFFVCLRCWFGLNYIFFVLHVLCLFSGVDFVCNKSFLFTLFFICFIMMIW